MLSSSAFTELAPESLAVVLGGDNNALGRCGPGTDWQFLGNVYTPECLAHDQKVRGEIESGTPRWLAHVRGLPLLPAAVGSYVRERFRGNG